MPHNHWEIWLDTQISPAIAKWMSDHTGFTVKSAYSLQSHTFSDIEIYQNAKAQGAVIIVSKDADFTELVSRLGPPPKLICIKFGNCDNKTFWERIKPQILEIFSILISTDTAIVEII